MVVEEVNANGIPKGWLTSESIYNTRMAFINNNWNLVWNKRSSNRLADVLAKMNLSTGSFYSFSSLNLDCLPKAFCNVYIYEIIGGSISVY